MSREPGGSDWAVSSPEAGCSVACKMFPEQLEDLCRRERLHCQDLGVSRANINHYEVEFLCDYKKTKVRAQPPNTLLLSAFLPLQASGCLNFLLLSHNL